MKRILVFLVVLVIAGISQAVPVVFSDPSLKAAVEAELSITDPNSDEMLLLINLDAHSQGISSLGGLEYATNLNTLLLYDNNIADISQLSGLNNMIVLSLGRNKLTSLTAISGLTSLQGLYFYENPGINTMSPISGLVNLTNLRGFDCNITDINVITNFPNLQMLSMAGNKISNISVVAGSANLTLLDLSENQIADYNAVSNHPRLIFLDLSYNDSNDMGAVVSDVNLIYLGFGGNGLTDINPAIMSALVRLEELYLSDNFLTGGDLVNLAGVSDTLTDLYLANNQIEDINTLAAFTKLVYLSLYGQSDNNVSNLSALAGLTDLEYLNLHFNNVSDINQLSGLTKLRYLYLSYNYNISNISILSDMNDLIELRLAYNKIEDLSPLTGLKNLARLIVSKNPLSPDSYCICLPAIDANNPVVCGTTLNYTLHPLLKNGGCYCSTDFNDLAIFSDRWLNQNCTAGNNYCGGADLDRSGQINPPGQPDVDFQDFVIFAEWWMYQP